MIVKSFFLQFEKNIKICPMYMLTNRKQKIFYLKKEKSQEILIN